MEAFLTECCFVLGCEGLSCSKEECFSAEIVELRCAVRKMILIQAADGRRNGQNEKEELDLPLYELIEGQLRPTGRSLSA